MMCNHMDEHFAMPHPHCGGFTGHFEGAPGRRHCGGFPDRGEEYRAMPRDFNDRSDDFRCMPRGHGMPGGHGFGPGGFGPGGMPPRRPDPAFLKRRIEESDLMELIDMAGRMAQRRPQGGPARSQALILSILAGRDDLSQRELQQMLAIQPGSLSELVSKLEGKGYLTREKAKDRRGNLLRITEAGRNAISSADKNPDDDPFTALSDAQQDELAALLRTLLNAWVDSMGSDNPRDRQPPLPHRDRPVEL